MSLFSEFLWSVPLTAAHYCMAFVHCPRLVACGVPHCPLADPFIESTSHRSGESWEVQQMVKPTTNTLIYCEMFTYKLRSPLR